MWPWSSYCTTMLWDRADRYRRHGLSEIRGTGTTRTADYEQHFELRDLIRAGERDRAADLLRRHIELSLLSLGPAGVARADDGIGPA